MLDRHYYVQIAPNNSFVGKWLSQESCHANDTTFMVIYNARTDDIAGGGLWHPEAAPLSSLREAIDQHPDRLKAALRDSRIRKEFLKGAAASDQAVVKAFVESNAESMLKTKPKVNLAEGLVSRCRFAHRHEELAHERDQLDANTGLLDIRLIRIADCFMF